MTAQKVEGLTGTSLPGNKPSYLHGRVTGPIPFWSHIYDGAWFREQLKRGWTVSEEVMGRAKKAVAVATAGVNEIVEPEPMPTGKARGRPSAVAKKQSTLSFPTAAVVAAAPAPTEPEKPSIRPFLQRKSADAVAEPVVAPPAPAPVKPVVMPKKKAPKAKVAAAAAAPVSGVGAPVAVVRPGPPEPVEDVVDVPVRRITIERRELLLDPKKQKLYDLKCKYIGRWDSNAGEIDTSFPDSDAD
jgi:hypothetical protein